MMNPQLILKQFTIIIQGESTQKIRNSQDILLQYEKDQNFMNNMAILLSSISVQFSIRKLAAVYLISYSKRINKLKANTLSQSNLQIYLNLLQNSLVPFELKQFIVIAIQTIINAQSNRMQRSILNDQYIKLINEINFTYLVFFGQSLLGKDNYTQQVRQIVKTTVEFSIKLALNLFDFSKQIILSNKQQYMIVLKLIKEYSILLKLYLKRIMLIQLECLKILYLPQLQKLITYSLQFTIKENQISSFIFISIQKEVEISRLMNNIKANYIAILNNSLRLLISHTRHHALLGTNKLYCKSTQIVELFIKQTANLLKNTAYYHLPTKTMLHESIDEILNTLANLIKVNDFYVTFINNKNIIIQNILFPCLALSPTDYVDFVQNQLEFVEHNIQIINRNLSLTGTQYQMDDEIKQYMTLKTYAAELLNILCKFQDGTLSQIFEYAFNILQNKQKGASKALMLLVSAILQHQARQRPQINKQLFNIIMQITQFLPPKIIDNQNKEVNIQYAYCLLILSKLFIFVAETNHNLIDKIYKIGLNVIQSTSTYEVQKHFAFQLFNNVCRVQIGKPMASNTILLYNNILKNMTTPPFVMLDSYFYIIKGNIHQFKQSTPLIIQVLQIMSMHIQRQVAKQHPIKILMNKCWNVIRCVGQSNVFIPDLIPNIEEIILPLLKYINGVKNVDYQEDIIMLLIFFLQQGRKVTINQQQIFEIIPKVFYNQNNCRFGQSFQAIQLFIFYGTQILKNNLMAIQIIFNMGLSSLKTRQYNKTFLSQNDNCEGVLILQSLILKCGDTFTQEIWISLVKAVFIVLQSNFKKQKFFVSNIYSLLTLILVHSHSFFSNEQNDLLLTKILQNIKVHSNIQYGPKIVIAGLTELLQLKQKPFIIKRYTQLIDIIITLLEITALKRQNMFDMDDETAEQKLYSQTLQLTKNELKQIDQFKYFKQKINKIKHYDIFRVAINQIPKAKRQFLSHILRIQRVMNEPRQIYKIKKELP